MLVELPVAPTVCSIPASSAVSTSSSKTFGERVAPRSITGPGAERVAAELLLVDAGGVGGVGDVDDDRQVGLDREGRGAGAEEADLLLDGGDRGEAALQRAALVAAAQRLEGDVGAEPVVHRARDQAVAGEAQRLGGDHDRVADPDQLGGLVAVGGADVDVQALQLDHLLARVGVEQVQRLAPDDAEHRAVPALDLDSLADQDLRVPAADRREPEEALLVDVADRRGRSRRCGRRRRAAATASPMRATEEPIPSAGERGEGGRLAPDRGGRRLVAGGPGGAEELVE